MILTCLFSLAINLISVYSQYTNIRKIQNVMIKYAQKNGGFMTVYDEMGNVKMRPDDLYNNLVTQYELQDKIESVQFNPGLNVPVQKAIYDPTAKFSISITPRVEIVVPFAGVMVFPANPIEVEGYSHKFFK